MSCAENSRGVQPGGHKGCVCVCARIYRSRVKLDLPAVGLEERKKIEVLFLKIFFLCFSFSFFFSFPSPPARAAAAWR